MILIIKKSHVTVHNEKGDHSYKLFDECWLLRKKRKYQKNEKIDKINLKTVINQNILNFNKLYTSNFKSFALSEKKEKIIL